jgi:hypothetical protein
MRRLLTLTTLLLASSCAVVQTIDAAIDCNGICDRYASCFDKGYDVSACAARCRKAASSEADYRHKADRCNACISARSCVQATFSCLTECVSVVP